MANGTEHPDLASHTSTTTYTLYTGEEECYDYDTLYEFPAHPNAVVIRDAIGNSCKYYRAW